MRRQSAVRGSRQRRSLLGGGGRAALATLAASAVLLVASPPARAQTDLAIRAGWGGAYRPGHPVPVWIEVSADRLIQGTLVVTADDGTETSIPVEVPGGSVKEYFLAVPTSPHDDEVTVRASVRAGDEQARGEAEVSFDGETELVGLLPGVAPPDLPAPINLPFDSGLVAFVEVTPSELEVPASLGALGTLIASPDGLAQLPAGARAGVLAWVEAGGRLVVDGPAGTVVAGLPDGWQPDDDGRTLAGLGEVRLGGGAAAAGRWADIVEPTPSLAVASPEQSFGRVGFFPISDTVARDAGLRLTTPGWLLAFLIAYVVVAGPITWFALRRLRRLGLAWAVIPAVAVVFAATSFVVGRDLRSGTQAAHGSIITTGEGGAHAITFVGTVSKNGGDGRVSLPGDWTASTLDQSWFGLESEAVTVTVGGERSAATIPLDAGEFGVLRAQGPITFEGGLEVEATATDTDTISGTVRNTTDQPLEDVGVFAGPNGAPLGRLEPGGEARFDIDTGGAQFPQGEPAEVDVWPAAVGWDRPINASGVVNIALWSEASLAFGPNLLAPGSVVAAGWTRDADTPARSGDDALDGRSLVLGRGPIATEAGTFNPFAVRHETLRHGASAESILDGFDANRRGEFFGHLIRLHLPENSPEDGLQLRLGPDVSAVAALAPGGWETVDNLIGEFRPERGPVPGDERTVDLPAGSVVEGTILLRVVSNFFFGGTTGPSIQVRSPAAAS